MTKSKLISAFTLFLLSGCSTQQLQNDVKRIERSLNDLRAYQSEQSETISSLDAQLKSISGRVEELEFSQNKKLGGDINALREDLSSLRRRVPPPSIVPASELDADEVWANTLSSEINAMFVDALQRLREGKFSDALPILQNVVEQLEGSDKAGVALFWQGVAYDGLDDDRGALKSYSEVISRYPRSPRSSTSLLRQSAVFTRLGDKKAASLSLQKLMDDYPRSSDASKAKERLKELR